MRAALSPTTAKGILLEGLERGEGRTGEHRQTDRLTVAIQTEGGKAEVPTGFHPTPLELVRPGSSGQAPKPCRPHEAYGPSSVLGER